MMIRTATLDDYPEIMSVYTYARNFMQTHGNPTQWNVGYPSEQIVKKDITAGNAYVIMEQEVLVGVFSLVIGKEKTYQIIEQGRWHYDELYGTIHRLAGNGKTHGIAKKCFDYCKGRIRYLRIDTHAKNKLMQEAILKNGFSKCGIIYVADGSSRIAFDYYPAL